MRWPIGQQGRLNQNQLINAPRDDPRRTRRQQDICTSLRLGHRHLSNASHQCQVRHKGTPKQPGKPRRFQSQRKAPSHLRQTLGNRLAAGPNQLLLRPAGQFVEMQQTAVAQTRLTRNTAARRIDERQSLIGHVTQEAEGHMQCFCAGHPSAKLRGGRNRQLVQSVCNGRRRPQGHKQSHDIFPLQHDITRIQAPAVSRQVTLTV